MIATLQMPAMNGMLVSENSEIINSIIGVCGALIAQLEPVLPSEHVAALQVDLVASKSLQEYCELLTYLQRQAQIYKSQFDERDFNVMSFLLDDLNTLYDVRPTSANLADSDRPAIVENIHDTCGMVINMAQLPDEIDTALRAWLSLATETDSLEYDYQILLKLNQCLQDNQHVTTNERWIVAGLLDYLKPAYGES